jgi:hypothetical protein
VWREPGRILTAVPAARRAGRDGSIRSLLSPHRETYSERHRRRLGRWGSKTPGALTRPSSQSSGISHSLTEVLTTSAKLRDRPGCCDPLRHFRQRPASQALDFPPNRSCPKNAKTTDLSSWISTPACVQLTYLNQRRVGIGTGPGVVERLLPRQRSVSVSPDCPL